MTSMGRASVIIGMLASGCALSPSPPSVEEVRSYGVHLGDQGYLPGRIAVTRCALWPKGLGQESQVLGVAKAVALLCERLDQFVAEGFKHQPYMQGYSPKAIDKMLASQAALMADRFSTWTLPPDSLVHCSECTSAPGVYRHRIAPKLPWRQWLHEFSRGTQYCDGLLIPFVLGLEEKGHLDRGLAVTIRSARVALFLIDTQDAGLLWSGFQEAAVSTQALPPPSKEPEFPAPAPWEQVFQKLFSEALWKEFPGRLIY